MMCFLILICYTFYMKFSNLKNKSWFDWLKIFIAIDLVSVGIGLILHDDFHILANFLGFLTRIPFGVMYIFIAILILRRVFPEALHIDPNDELHIDQIDNDFKKGIQEGRGFLARILKSFNYYLKKMIDWVDRIFDNILFFFKKRPSEKNRFKNNPRKK